MCVGTERMLQSINDGWYRRADFQSCPKSFSWDGIFYFTGKGASAMKERILPGRRWCPPLEKRNQ